MLVQQARNHYDMGQHISLRGGREGSQGSGFAREMEESRLKGGRP